MPLTIDQIIPGGIKASDHLHVGTNDNTCSRCRKAIEEDECPLMLWANDGNDMWIFCEACCGVPAEQRAARKWGVDE
jgi:hypothetical protein